MLPARVLCTAPARESYGRRWSELGSVSSHGAASFSDEDVCTSVFVRNMKAFLESTTASEGSGFCATIGQVGARCWVLPHLLQCESSTTTLEVVSLLRFGEVGVASTTGKAGLSAASTASARGDLLGFTPRCTL